MASESDFDMRQSNEMWDNFQRISKWIVICAVILLLLMGYFLTGK